MNDFERPEEGHEKREFLKVQRELKGNIASYNSRELIELRKELNDRFIMVGESSDGNLDEEKYIRLQRDAAKALHSLLEFEGVLMHI